MLEYARWQMSATIGGVHVSASSITEEHRDETLKVWRGMQARNITIVERSDALPLPRWKVRVPTIRGYEIMEFQASSKKMLKQKLSDNRLKLEPWQVMTAKIEQA